MPGPVSEEHRLINHRGLAVLAGAAPLAPNALRALATAFLTRPPTLVIPFPPGGIVDTVGRLIAEHVVPHLGQPITIENRPGAGTVLANAHVAASRPGGYSIFAGGIGLAIIPTES